MPPALVLFWVSIVPDLVASTGSEMEEDQAEVEEDRALLAPGEASRGPRPVPPRPPSL